MNFDDFDPKSLRMAVELQTGKPLSQAMMAELMGVDPSQISRWEKNPSSMSLEVVQKWARICGDIPNKGGFDVDASSRDNLVSETKKIGVYVDNALQFVGSPPESDEFSDQYPSLEDLLTQVRNFARKPRIGVCGRFDQGKSRLINTLLGQDILPTGYQPETSLICLIRHTSDRPEWMKAYPEAMNQEVFLMKKASEVDGNIEKFDFNRLDEQKYFDSFRCMAGGLDVLKDFGTTDGRHAKSAKSQDMHAALLFIDFPLLINCDFLDFPGYGNSKTDHDKAEFAKGFIDILIYASGGIGFFDQNDRIFFNGLVKQLPPIENEGSDSLRNAFVIVTRASLIGSSADLARICDRAGESAYDFLQGTFSNIREGGVSKKSFKRRFFTFDAEVKDYCKNFESDLAELLERVYPSTQRKRIGGLLSGRRESAVEQLLVYSSNIDDFLTDAASKMEELKILEDEEPLKKIEINRKCERVRDMISTFKKDTVVFINNSLKPECNPENIEKLIRSKGWKKKAAQEQCGAYLVNDLQNRLDKFIGDRSKDLAGEVEELLDIYKADKTFIGTPFDTRGAFIGGLVGLGTYGALSVWASIVAAGSNLGAYILTAKVVSALSAIGISVGGTAAAASAVAAIGGPVTIMVGLAVLLGALAWWLSGKTWQNRLAKKIADLIIKEDIIWEFTKISERYWDDTKKAFDKGIEATKNERVKYMKNLRKQIEDFDEKSLIEQKEFIAKLRSAWEKIPSL